MNPNQANFELNTNLENQSVKMSVDVPVSGAAAPTTAWIQATKQPDVAAGIMSVSVQWSGALSSFSGAQLVLFWSAVAARLS